MGRPNVHMTGLRTTETANLTFLVASGNEPRDRSRTMRVIRAACLFTVLSGYLMSFTACDMSDDVASSDPPAPVEKKKSPQPSTGERNTNSKWQREPKRPERPRRDLEPDSPETEEDRARRSIFLQSGPLGQSGMRTTVDQPSHAGQFSGLSATAATQRMLRILEDSIEFQPTTVVWLVDCSPSAQNWWGGIRDELMRFYRQQVNAKLDLETQLICFGESVKAEFSSPTADAGEVLNAISSIEVDSSGREQTFQAVDEALEKYLILRKKNERTLILVVITDERGDDDGRLDQVIREPKKYALPIYVLGVPAPFGTWAGLSSDIEPGQREATPDNPQGLTVRQGPETWYPEAIQLGYPESGETLMDSGFGPYALERLCRETGGEYLAIRAPGDGSLLNGAMRNQWPAADVAQFDPAIMARYAPRPQSQQAYLELVQNNSAWRALHRACQLPAIEVIGTAAVRFEGSDQARLSGQVRNFQQIAAKIEPDINRLYELLNEGAAGRDSLPGLRERLAFDLAWARAMAAKSRVDSYNVQLAALRRGMKFEKESSNTWVLEPSDDIGFSSSIRRIAAQATETLQTIVAEHPGTPWAESARLELQVPLSWNWREE